MTILRHQRTDEVQAPDVSEKTLVAAAPAEKAKLRSDVEHYRKHLIALDAEIQRASGAAPIANLSSTGPVRLKATPARPATPSDTPVPY